MIKARPPPTAGLEPDERAAAREASQEQSSRNLAAEDFVVASHESLFARSESVHCDACGEPLDDEDLDGGDSYEMRGAGVYLWARGDGVEREKAPLCASCASAIGMTALARWEIEEEEG
jgi:hypothetical protein